MKPFERGIQPFVVSGEPSKTRGPGEASFDDPSAWQQHEAAFRHGMLDHLQPQAVLLGGFGGVRSGVALVHIGQLDCVAGHLLYLFCQRGDLLAIALIGRRDGQRQQVTERVDCDMNLGSLAPLGSVVAARAPDSGVDWRVRLSITTAGGWPLRPSHSRNKDRVSSTSNSKQPALSQRCIC